MNPNQAEQILRRTAGTLSATHAEELISHSLAVRDEVSRAGGSVLAQVVALLHDVIEDTIPSNFYNMQEKYADSLGLTGEVKDAVIALSRKYGEVYSDYIERVKNSSAVAGMVKRSDLRVNITRSLKRNAPLVKRYRKALDQLSCVFERSGTANRSHWRCTGMVVGYCGKSRQPLNQTSHIFEATGTMHTIWHTPDVISVAVQ